MGKGLVIVTGASQGIGRAVVEKYCGEGYPVIACARGEEHLQALKNAVSHLAGDLTTLKVDMSDKSEVQGFVEAIKGMDCEIGVLVNNVGVFIPGNIIDEPEGQLEKQMDTNLYSAYYLTRGIVPLMTEAGRGHVFNLCSTASLSAYPNGSSYSITKYALLGFSHNLREELKSRGIKVTAILPGNTLTASWEGTDLPEERFIKPADVAESIYSISQLSSHTDVEEVLIQPQYKA